MARCRTVTRVSKRFLNMGVENVVICTNSNISYLMSNLRLKSMKAKVCPYQLPTH